MHYNYYALLSLCPKGPPGQTVCCIKQCMIMIGNGRETGTNSTDTNTNTNTINTNKYTTTTTNNNNNTNNNTTTTTTANNNHHNITNNTHSNVGRLQLARGRHEAALLALAYYNYNISVTYYGSSTTSIHWHICCTSLYRLTIYYFDALA